MPVGLDCAEKPSADRYGSASASGNTKPELCHLEKRRVSARARIQELNLNAGESAAWGAAGFHAHQAAEKYLKPSSFSVGSIRPSCTRSIS